jgi:hypothetical protein
MSVETANLTKRFNHGYGNISPKNCYRGGQATNCKLNNLVFWAAIKGETITLWFCRTQEYKECERSILSKFKPPWNGILLAD